jgi:hypothetical protein
MSNMVLATSDFALESYHLAWLSVHPERSAGWLKDKLRDGFHVHHIDGDHSNDAPINLVLIDGTDHMRLHGMKLADGIRQWRSKKRSNPKPTEAENAPSEAGLIYSKKAKTPGSWVEFAKVYYSGVKPTDGPWHDIGGRLSMKARKYAVAQGKAWPPV